MVINKYDYSITTIFLLIFGIINISFSQSGWFQLNSGTSKNIYSVKFLNANTGWCVGDSGKILKTTNGGTNWNQQSSGYKNNLRSLAITSENTGFVVGDSGLTLKTTDGGLSWVRLSLVKPLYFFSSVFFVNDNLGYIGGIDYYFNSSNKIFKTSNSGSSWDSIETGAKEYVKAIFFINSTTGWFVRGNALVSSEGVAKTINGGVNWFFQFGGMIPYFNVYFADSLNGWLAGRNLIGVYTIFRTTNGGDNWSSSFPGLGYSMYSLYFTNNERGWASGERRLIFYTSDGGNNWINQTSIQAGINYRSIYFTDSLTGWVVGDSGIILKTTTGGVLTGFSTTSSEIPDRYYLSQNYPNPFNPVTDLEFGISKFGFVSVKVYDVLGNEVAVIVNERKNPGSYNYQFSSVNYQLPSGIYYYTLSVDGNLIDTKRMVLLK